MGWTGVGGREIERMRDRGIWQDGWILRNLGVPWTDNAAAGHVQSTYS